MVLLKEYRVVRWVRVGGRLSTGWLNSVPTVRWMSEGGSLSTG
jgi:hypothetical protein